jgi:hypothetical protein
MAGASSSRRGLAGPSRAVAIVESPPRWALFVFVVRSAWRVRRRPLKRVGGPADILSELTATTRAMPGYTTERGDVLLWIQCLLAEEEQAPTGSIGSTPAAAIRGLRPAPIKAQPPVPQTVERVAPVTPLKSAAARNPQPAGLSMAAAADPLVEAVESALAKAKASRALPGPESRATPSPAVAAAGPPADQTKAPQSPQPRAMRSRRVVPPGLTDPATGAGSPQALHRDLILQLAWPTRRGLGSVLLALNFRPARGEEDGDLVVTEQVMKALVEGAASSLRSSARFYRIDDADLALLLPETDDAGVDAVMARLEETLRRALAHGRFPAVHLAVRKLDPKAVAESGMMPARMAPPGPLPAASASSAA